MAITAGMVKDLREKTGMGMMECKKALEENHGDMEKAIVWLRERGMSRAAKKADKIAAEGVVEVYVTDDKATGVLLEVNCQTDFVAKNEEFVAIAKKAAQAAVKSKVHSVEELANLKLEDGVTVATHLVELSAKIGEKMELRRLKVVHAANGLVAGYSHMGGRIGTLVVLEGAKSDAVESLGKDLAMHVAASSPKYLKETEIDVAELATEKEIAKKKLEEEGKPADMIEKILVGQMKKFAKEICLVEQPFVKDPNVTVSKHVDNSKTGVKLTGFARFALGEGIEKKTENFAEEVAAQAAAASKKH